MNVFPEAFLGQRAVAPQFDCVRQAPWNSCHVSCLVSVPGVRTLEWEFILDAVQSPSENSSKCKIRIRVSSWNTTLDSSRSSMTDFAKSESPIVDSPSDSCRGPRTRLKSSIAVDCGSPQERELSRGCQHARKEHLECLAHFVRTIRIEEDRRLPCRVPQTDMEMT